MSISTNDWNIHTVPEGRQNHHFLNSYQLGDVSGGSVTFYLWLLNSLAIIPKSKFVQIVAISLSCTINNLNSDAHYIIHGNFSHTWGIYPTVGQYSIRGSIPMEPTGNNTFASTPIDKLYLNKPINLGRPYSSPTPYIRLYVTPNQTSEEYYANIHLISSDTPFKFNIT